MFRKDENPETIAIMFEKYRKEEAINQSDTIILKQFLQEQTMSSGAGIGRSKNLLYHLYRFRKATGVPFEALTLPVVYDGIQTLIAAKKENGEPFSSHVTKQNVASVKTFLLWMIQESYLTLPEEKIKKIKTPKLTAKPLKSDDLLTAEEVTAMINAGLSVKDRAFISILYETGCRVSEVARLTWKDLVFNPPFGIKCYVADEKVGTTRYVRLLSSVSLLSTWKNMTPKPGDDDPVFITRTGDPMNYDLALWTVRKLAKRAGIQKNVHPHLFRHTRITHLIASGVQESVIKKMMWNNLNSQMFSVYVSLGEEDIDRELAQNAGIKMKDPQKKFLDPIQCQGCGELNGPTHQFCCQCGKPLTPDARATVDEITAYAKAQPEYAQVQAMLQRMIEDMTGQNP
jgi:integrase